VKEQLKERERALKVKDESLAKLREQMKHLESFRFVLFHKVRALEEERDPLEEQVASLRTGVSEMYNEFVREFRQKQMMDQQLTQQNTLANTLQEENVSLRNQLVQLKKDGRRLLNDCETVLHPESHADFEKMPKILRETLEKHTKLKDWNPPTEEEQDDKGGGDQAADAHQALVEEMVIQRDLLFRKNQIAVGAASQAKRECAQDLRRLTSENAQLIHEMNTLRNENKSWQRSHEQISSSLMAMKAAGATGRSGASGGGSMGGRTASAPDLDASKANRSAGETPYMRRKVVDQQDNFRRKKQQGMNQLPPVNQPAGGVSLVGPGQPGSTVQEKRFSQSLGEVQAGRRQLEQQGFDVSRMGEQAAANVDETATAQATAAG